jgi:hypothetical protein
MPTKPSCVFKPKEPPMGVHSGYHAACQCGWLGQVHETLVGAESQWSVHQRWMVTEYERLNPSRLPSQTGQEAQCHVCGCWVPMLKKGTAPTFKYTLRSHNDCQNVAISPDGRNPIFRVDEEELKRRLGVAKLPAETSYYEMLTEPCRYEGGASIWPFCVTHNRYCRDES